MVRHEETDASSAASEPPKALPRGNTPDDAALRKNIERGCDRFEALLNDARKSRVSIPAAVFLGGITVLGYAVSFLYQIGRFHRLRVPTHLVAVTGVDIVSATFWLIVYNAILLSGFIGWVPFDKHVKRPLGRACVRCILSGIAGGLMAAILMPEERPLILAVAALVTGICNAVLGAYTDKKLTQDPVLDPRLLESPEDIETFAGQLEGVVKYMEEMTSGTKRLVFFTLGRVLTTFLLLGVFALPVSFWLGKADVAREQWYYVLYSTDVTKGYLLPEAVVLDAQSSRLICRGCAGPRHGGLIVVPYPDGKNQTLRRMLLGHPSQWLRKLETGQYRPPVVGWPPKDATPAKPSKPDS